MFSGQNVAITGGAGGIGRGFAEMFIKNGANVAICDLKRPDETAAEIGAHAFDCDVSDEAQVRKFVDDAQAALGAD